MRIQTLNIIAEQLPALCEKFKHPIEDIADASVREASQAKGDQDFDVFNNYTYVKVGDVHSGLELRLVFNRHGEYVCAYSAKWDYDRGIIFEKVTH